MIETSYRPTLQPQAHKHRLYKYSQNWYGDCGICMRALWSPRWVSTLGLLTLHVQEHQPLTLDPSVG